MHGSGPTGLCREARSNSRKQSSIQESSQTHSCGYSTNTCKAEVCALHCFPLAAISACARRREFDRPSGVSFLGRKAGGPARRPPPPSAEPLIVAGGFRGSLVGAAAGEFTNRPEMSLSASAPVVATAGCLAAGVYRVFCCHPADACMGTQNRCQSYQRELELA